MQFYDCVSFHCASACIAHSVIIIVFTVAGLFSIVLCQVFEKAVQYKLENDLTI